MVCARIDLTNTCHQHNPAKDTPYPENYKYNTFFYEMHVNAYAACSCSGTPAPKLAWLVIFYASEIIPCNMIEPVAPSVTSVIGAILEFGRCGCGW